MKQLARAAAMSPLPLTLVAAACGGGLDRDLSTLPSEGPPRSAGNVGLGIAPDRDAAEIAALRDRGPEALDELLAAYDRTTGRAERAGLAATIDKVAAQRYATVSRLFWYTDLAEARAESTASGKPILSLRMLGRLDEDLSCANSRFFRTVLYPDPAVAQLLRDKFVLHWSSERDVPRVTIDFGDGRTLERTIAGNSIHYVLDADGTPIDALPGMYAPTVFVAELGHSLELHGQLKKAADAKTRAQLVHVFHADRARQLGERWGKLAGTITLDFGTGRILTGRDADDALAKAQRATMSKAMVEAPELARLDIGSDPSALEPDVKNWAIIGQALFGLGPSTPPPPRANANGVPGEYFPGQAVRARRKRAAEPVASAGILSAPARQLVIDVMTAGTQLEPERYDLVIAQLERSVIADTAINELQIRDQIHSRLASDGALPGFAELNRYVYADLFATPAEDAWLGLLPRDVYTGLPGDGVVVQD
jgi:hypothetical protein